MSKLVEIYFPVNCPHRSQRKCLMTKYGGDCMGNYFPKNCPLPNAPREGAPQKCPQDRCPKCGGLMIDITSGRQALYPQYVNDKTYACMVCHHRERRRTLRGYTEGGETTLYLVRGLPGSGKSTYAKGLGCFHVEADMFHIRNGVYRFDGSRAKLAHNWCQKTAFVAMEQGMDVVVSNTFTMDWETWPYVTFAEKTGHVVKIIRMTGEYGTTHNVPAETLENMKKRFQDIEGEEIVC
jgi:hypothetical protein